MGKFIALGIPTHFTKIKRWSVCGVSSPQFHTEDIENVNCLRCFKTHAFKKALEGHKWSKQ